MKNRSVAMLVASVLLGGGMAASVTVLASDDGPKSMPAHSEGSMALHKVMDDGAKMPMTMTGDVDRDFAMMMTMHHHQAIRMADVLLREGKNADLKAMASKMKSDQQKEIAALKPHMR